jgi:hypothetical protein
LCGVYQAIQSGPFRPNPDYALILQWSAPPQSATPSCKSGPRTVFRASFSLKVDFFLEIDVVINTFFNTTNIYSYWQGKETLFFRISLNFRKFVPTKNPYCHNTRRGGGSQTFVHLTATSNKEDIFLWLFQRVIFVDVHFVDLALHFQEVRQSSGR